MPKSKPIWFTEIGCAAVDKGGNQPNVFPDEKSSEGSIPHFSNGLRSDFAQHQFLLAHYLHWEEYSKMADLFSEIYNGPMINPSNMTLWAWDARPFPAFPSETQVWNDGENWSRGHWLNGRLNTVAVGALINAILADHKLELADTLQAAGMVEGYVISNPSNARAELEPIVNLFRIGVREDEGKLVFVTEAAGEGIAKVVRDMVVPENGDTLIRTRDPDHMLPATMHLDFRNQLDDYQSAVAEVNYIGAKGLGTAYASFPGVLDPHDASALIRNYLRTIWEGREQISFNTVFNEQNFRIGNVIRFGDCKNEYLITEIEEGLTRQIKARSLLRVADLPGMQGGAYKSQNQSNFTYGKPYVVLMDLPVVNPQAIAEEQLQVAAIASPWKRQAVLSSPMDSGYELRGFLEEPATIGMLLKSLRSASTEGRIDYCSELNVKLFNGELNSINRTHMLNGSNYAAVLSENGLWEVLQFECAEEIDINTWRISGLLRGQLGTNDAMVIGAPMGAPFVLLNTSVNPIELRPEESGLELNWRIGPVGYDFSDKNYLTDSVIGGVRAKLPLSPVFLRGNFLNNDLCLTWIRRGRINADSWIGNEIPLGEESEVYEVKIALQGDSSFVRQITTSQPEWTYTKQMILDDLGTGNHEIDVMVRQMSQIVGAGVSTRKSFRLQS